jgi:hypothetical protein
MYSKEIFKTDEGFGYKILKDDVVVIVQDFKPGVEGWISMTERRSKSVSRRRD